LSFLKHFCRIKR